MKRTVSDVLATVPVGARVRLRRDVDRYPHFVAEAGRTGVVTSVDKYGIEARMDKHLPGAEEWDNAVVWYVEPYNDNGNCDLDDFFADAEVLP